MSDEPAPLLPRVRKAFTTVGIVGVFLVLAYVGLFGLALAQGVHCPDCDRMKLGDGYAWWKGYFGVMEVLWAAGGLAGLASVVVAARRRWGALALALALVTSFRPL